MAIVYSQSWAAGNSTFDAGNTYDRNGDGEDPLYKEAKIAEAVTISTIAGSPRLTWNGFSDWNDTAWVVEDNLGDPGNGYPTSSSRFTFNGQVGKISCRYRPDATSLSVVSFAPLIVVPFRGGFSDNWFLAWDRDNGWFEIDLATWGFANPDVNDTVAYGGFSADTDYTLTICWKCGTPDTTPIIGDVASDGYWRFYINGVLIYEKTDVALWLDENNGNLVPQVNFGQFGMLGALDQIVFNDAGCITPIVGSHVFGTKGTIQSTRTFMANLDDTTRSINMPGTFFIGGDLVVTGTTTITGDVSTTSPATLMNSIVTASDGSIVLDSDGNVVFVNGT
jgi:hypothetical protein